MHKSLCDHVFMLAGFGSEYPFKPLEQHLRKRGYAVLACNMQHGPMPELPEGPSIFITSQHPACTSFVFRRYWGQEAPFSNYVGPLEIIGNLHPVASIFVPHDLETPIRPEELVFMAAFDFYCAPTETANPGLHRLCKVIPTGWIKHPPSDPLPRDLAQHLSTKGIFFVNQVVTLMRSGGAKYFQSRYPEVFSDSIPIKLPTWPGCNELARQLRGRGAMVIDDSVSSMCLIAASNAVLINTMGSVAAEARYFGKPVTLLPGGGAPGRVVCEARPGHNAREFDIQRLLVELENHVELSKS